MYYLFKVVRDVSVACMRTPLPNEIARKVENAVHLKPGTRLRSQVDSTEVIVVRPQGDPAVISCGGHPMVAMDGARENDLQPTATSCGTKLGKRYSTADGTLELLVTKGGSGDLAVDGAILNVKDAKPLPASD